MARQANAVFLRLRDPSALRSNLSVKQLHEDDIQTSMTSVDFITSWLTLCIARKDFLLIIAKTQNCIAAIMLENIGRVRGGLRGALRESLRES